MARRSEAFGQDRSEGLGRFKQAVLVVAGWLAGFTLALAPLTAQEPSVAVIAPGEAAVTGFSGAPAA
jgi:hypothetical protein